MKLGNLVNLKILIASKSNEEVSFSTARKMMRVFKWIDQEENLPFFEKKRKEIIEKYVDKDSNGKPIEENGVYKFTEQNMKDASAAFTSLSETIIDTPEDLKFTEEELSSLKFTVKDVATLDDLIKD